MSDKTIYLDYAAATPLDKRALKAMEPYFRELFFNPSSAYQPARDVRQAVRSARGTVAKLLGAKPDEIIFTAGASESIALAFHGLLDPASHVVTTTIEHAAVIETAKNYNHTFVPVNRYGRVEPAEVARAVRDETRLVSIGFVNNEIGTVQPIKEIAALLQKIRAGRQAAGNQTPLLLHSDGSQAGGMLSLQPNRLGMDLLTLNGAKMYGPKQTGLLWVKSPVTLVPLIAGGGQERGLRSGTENVAGIVGLATAFKHAEAIRPAEAKRLSELRDSLAESMQNAFTETMRLGDIKHCAPHILTLSWPGLDAERLLFGLEQAGVLVATGAACAANKATRSHVLTALGLENSVIDGSVRFSFGHDTTASQLKRAAKIIKEVINKERQRM